MIHPNKREVELGLYLEQLYDKYNRRAYVCPDPLQFLYSYQDVADREIVALIASSLAYGRVIQILRSVSDALRRIGPNPLDFLKVNALGDIKHAFAGFQHRFTKGEDMSFLLHGAKKCIAAHGSLCACFRQGVAKSDQNILFALTAFVQQLRNNASDFNGNLLPAPSKGSACKRLHLFLRWMVRCDDVDPGGWDSVAPSKLVIPLDTHMFTIGRALGFTSRRQADAKAALEVTDGFRRYSPDDPAKYDFSLTRFGIRNDMRLSSLLNIISS